jgi:hypothetical protein
MTCHRLGGAECIRLSCEQRFLRQSFADALLYVRTENLLLSEIDVLEGALAQTKPLFAISL